MARVVPLVLAVLALAIAAGCGGGEEASPAPVTVEGAAPADGGGGGGDAVEGDPEAGKEIFASTGCGSCHTLDDAGSSGTIGPNLDDSSVDYGEAVDQITNGGGVMKAYSGELSEEEIANVAAYVVTARG